jgi:hypothetical protein
MNTIWLPSVARAVLQVACVSDGTLSVTAPEEATTIAPQKKKKEKEATMISSFYTRGSCERAPT